ncbi:MAG: alanine racemase [Acidobacteria bacterium]|nr:alanine racemase [Acidobacteriota bacterium]
MPFPCSSRPTWAEISVGALRRNFQRMRQLTGPGVTVCGVVKADAYGHGAIECSRALEAEGAEWLGVTCTDEGVRLRRAGIQSRILIMTGCWRGEEADAVRYRLTPAVWQEEAVARLHHAAAEQECEVPIHIKVDTGMSRLGAPVEAVEQLCRRLHGLPRVRVEGALTHLAASEVLDGGSQRQLAAFETALNILRNHGFDPPIVDAANSSAMVALPQARYNFVRPGISLYGYYLPFSAKGEAIPQPAPPAVEPVLSWKTRVTGMRNVSRGTAIGYGRTYHAERAMTVAVLPVGYADGLNRKLSSKGRVLVRGAEAPITGRVSMDLTLIDVSSIPGVEIGDEVTLLGRSGPHAIDAWEHARHSGTIPYEVLCAISARVPRIFVP